MMISLSPEDRATFHEMREALFISTPNKFIAYLCDRYRAGALHVLPAFSSQALKDEERARIERIAGAAGRREAKSLLYEERFITDPK